MGALHRIRFYIQQAVGSLKWNMTETICPAVNRKKEQESNTVIDSLGQEFADEFAAEMKDVESNVPELVPDKTMLFFSRPEEHSCNFITAFYHRKRIGYALAWAEQRGISTFLADYSTPFGLLALETMLQKRDNGAEIMVCAAKGHFIGKRKTYRLIKETPIEIAFLTARADYVYSMLPMQTFYEVFLHAGIHCSETGIWISKNI